MSGVEIRQLECFIAVAEEANLSRAAVRLHMTQPPLTRRIKRLERDVGAVLFDRTTTGLELTEAGAVLLEKAYRILALTDQAVERTRTAGAGALGRLTVGYNGSTIFEAVPRLLAAFLAEHPEVTLRLERAAKNVQAEAIRDGRMHIGFGRLYHEELGLRVRHVLGEPLFCALGAQHRLGDRDALRVADLREVPLVLFPSAPRPSFADVVSEMCRRGGFVPQVAHEAEDVVTALAQVAATGAAAVVPRSATNVTLPGMRFTPLLDGPEQAVECLYREGGRSPVLRSLLDFLDRWSPAPQRGGHR